jgi:hypothetical protein
MKHAAESEIVVPLKVVGHGRVKIRRVVAVPKFPLPPSRSPYETITVANCKIGPSVTWRQMFKEGLKIQLNSPHCVFNRIVADQ